MGGTTDASPTITLFFYTQDTNTITDTATREARLIPFDVSEFEDDDGAGYLF